MTGPDDHRVTLGSGLPETVLPRAAAAERQALDAALSEPIDARRQAVADVVAHHPAFLDGWAELGHLARDPVEAYACFRVGYHRGLDALRAAGWRGSGFVRWAEESNRGFLRSLSGLANSAEAIGETSEAARCSQFLRQLAPDFPRHA